MPVYEYICNNCNIIEIKQSIKDDPLTQCPKCGSLDFKKIISISSFHLKGTGWFRSDYKEPKENKKAKPKE